MSKATSKTITEFEKHFKIFLKSRAKSAFFDKNAFSPKSIEYRQGVRQLVEQHDLDYFEFEASTLNIDRLTRALLSSTNIKESHFKILCNHIEHESPAVICVYRCSELASSTVQLLSRLNEHLKKSNSTWKLAMFGDIDNVYPLYLRQLSPESSIGKGDYSAPVVKRQETDGKTTARISIVIAGMIVAAVCLWLSDLPKSPELDNESNQSTSPVDQNSNYSAALTPPTEADTKNVFTDDENHDWQSKVDEFEEAMAGFSNRDQTRRPSYETNVTRPNIKSQLMPETLHQALVKGDLDETKRLISKDNLISSTTSNAETPLIIAGLKNHLSLVDWLIEQGSDINSVDSDGRSALYYAAVNGNSAFAKKLLANKANINRTSRLKKSPLMAAVHNNHLELCSLLLSSGSKVNQQDHSGWSALFYAVWNENLDIVKMLRNSGANIELQDKDGYTVIDIAVARNAGEVLAELNRD